MDRLWNAAMTDAGNGCAHVAWETQSDVGKLQVQLQRVEEELKKMQNPKFGWFQDFPPVRIYMFVVFKTGEIDIHVVQHFFLQTSHSPPPPELVPFFIP